jgi:short subunit dehydrogenase-like uncharacterized protein
MDGRPYDLVLHGASGFVGRQAIAYLSEHTKAGNLRWAIAGRDAGRLAAARNAAGTGAACADILVTDSQDDNSVDAIASRTRVVLNAAGPFALYGSTIVDACVRRQTHYVDITGETLWMKGLIDRHHARAAAEGTRIVPGCGFDSVPSDLGTLHVVHYIRDKLGVACRDVKAYFQVRGGLNGGTLASAFNAYESGQRARYGDPFLLNPPGSCSAAAIERSRDPSAARYDADVATWVAPFFMGAINTRVVRRSAALHAEQGEPYGPDFSYQEYLRVDPPRAGMKAVALAAALRLFEGAMSQTPIRRTLRRLLPKPGSGPSEKTMNEGWFRCWLLAVAADGRKVRALVHDQGDPGNRVTVKCLCESALSLVENAHELPGGARRGGVLTPATAFGEVLAMRLRKCGMTIEIMSS